jgi:hypothetical protein
VGELRSVRTKCPLCSHVFLAPHVGTYVTVGRETDLCPKFPGLTFDERYDIEERLQEDGLLKVFRASPPPWLAFHAAEVCGQERGLRFRELGDLCLRASWVCRKEREHPFESTFQLRALRYFIRALREEGLHGRELSVTTYLVGELNRRLGNHREALNWYVNAERTLGDEAGRDASLAWLGRLISEQSKLAKEQAA